MPDNPFPFDNAQVTDSPFRIVSDNPTLSIGVNEVFQLGAGYRDPSKQSSTISFSVHDSSILASGPVSAKDGYQYLSLTAQKAGKCSVRVNDTQTGEFVDVPVTVTEPAQNAYTIYNVPTVSVDKTTANIYNINGITIDGFHQTTNDDGSCDMSFDAYNANWIYGIVEIYNADNSLRDCVLLDKGNRAAVTGIKEAVWDNGKDLFSDLQNGALLSYKQASGYASKTSVDIRAVPKGGYIRITNSLKESGILSVVNLVDIASDVLTTAKSAKDLHTTVQNHKFMDSVTKAVIKSSLFLDAGKSSQNLANGIAEKVMKTSVTDKQSIGPFLDSVAATLSEMDFDEIMGEAAVEEGVSVAESNLLKFSGPAGIALGSMFTLNSMSNAAMESLSFCRSEFKNGVVIQVPDNNARSSDGVFVKLTKPIADNVALSVFKITYDQDAAARFLTACKRECPQRRNTSRMNT